MKALTPCLLITFSILAGCAADQKSRSQGDDTPGYEVAYELSGRYYDTAMKCQNDTPAFHCSGVLLTVTDSLEPSPAERERNTVSFTYVRQDTLTTHLYANGTAGIILKTLPYADTNRLSIRCSFPVNGNTNSRPDGCGKTTSSAQDPELSRFCDEQGINDVERWHAHWQKVGHDENFTCALRPTTHQFALSIKARKDLEFYYRKRWNEVVTSAWQASDLGAVPFQAFFHNPANPENLETAQKLQRDFYMKTGIILPIIRVTLCTEHLDDSEFTYVPADQLLRPLPPARATLLGSEPPK